MQINTNQSVGYITPAQTEKPQSRQNLTETALDTYEKNENTYTTTKPNFAAPSNSSDATNRKALEEGFKAILNNPKSSDNDKMIAKLGINFGGFTVITDKESNQIGEAVMKVIEKGTDGPAVSLIAETIEQATAVSSNAMVTRDILGAGFEAIVDHPEAEPFEKKLAESGINTAIDADGNFIEDNAAVEARLAVLQEFLKNIVVGNREE